jgi:hypothetical protein
MVIKMGCGCVDYITVALNGVKWNILVNTVIEFGCDETC